MERVLAPEVGVAKEQLDAAMPVMPRRWVIRMRCRIGTAPQIVVTLSNTNLLQFLGQTFGEFDTDQDGTLDREEFAQVR